MGIPVALDRLLHGNGDRLDARPRADPLARRAEGAADRLPARTRRDLRDRLVADRGHLAVRVDPLRAARPLEPARLRAVLRRPEGISRGARPQRAARHAGRARGLPGAHGTVREVGPDALVVPDYILDPNVGTHERSRARAVRGGRCERAALYGVRDRRGHRRDHLARPPLEAGRRDRRRALRARDPAHRHARRLDRRHARPRS